MLAFVIQRLVQAALVMLVISAMVFVGVYAVGNPIDVMIGPDVTHEIRQRRSAPTVLTSRCGNNMASFWSGWPAAISVVRLSTTCRCWA